MLPSRNEKKELTSVLTTPGRKSRKSLTVRNTSILFSESKRIMMFSRAQKVPLLPRPSLKKAGYCQVFFELQGSNLSTFHYSQ